MRPIKFYDKVKFCKKLAERNGPFWLIQMCDRRNNEIFLSEQDYLTGTNLLALGYHESGARILTFTITGKHLFAVTSGTPGQQESLLELLRKKLMRMTTMQKLNKIEITKSICQPLIGLKSLCLAICYVNSRCSAHSLQQTVSNYRWSAARHFFSRDTPLQESCRIDHMTFRRKREIFRFKFNALPPQWLVERGCIYAASFCSIAEAESYFSNAHHYATYLNNLQSYIDQMPFLIGLDPEPTDCEISDLASNLNLTRQNAKLIIKNAVLP